MSDSDQGPKVFEPMVTDEFTRLWDAWYGLFRGEILDTASHQANRMAVTAPLIRMGLLETQDVAAMPKDVGLAVASATRAKTLTSAVGFLVRYFAARHEVVASVMDHSPLTPFIRYESLGAGVPGLRPTQATLTRPAIRAIASMQVTVAAGTAHFDQEHLALALDQESRIDAARARSVIHFNGTRQLRWKSVLVTSVSSILGGAASLEERIDVTVRALCALTGESWESLDDESRTRIRERWINRLPDEKSTLQASVAEADIEILRELGRLSADEAALTLGLLLVDRPRIEQAVQRLQMTECLPIHSSGMTI